MGLALAAKGTCMLILREMVDAHGVPWVYGRGVALDRFGGVHSGVRVCLQWWHGPSHQYATKHITAHSKAHACSLLHRHCLGYDV